MRGIDTGIGIDDESLNMVRPLRVRVRCPHCNEEHVVSVKDAEVADVDAA